MGTVSTITPPGTPPRERTGPPSPYRPALRPAARLDVEQAREFLMKLPRRTRGADLPAAMFLLGRLAEHAQALLDVLDATVAVS